MFTTINIRGTKFDVNNDTLKKMDYFEALLSRWESGEIFIDRCPESFGHILDFLVYGNIFLDQKSLLRGKIISDAVYYRVHDIADRLIPPGFHSHRPTMEIFIQFKDLLNASLIGENPIIWRFVMSIFTSGGFSNMDFSDIDLCPRVLIEYIIYHEGPFSRWVFLDEKYDAKSAECIEKKGNRCFIDEDGVNPCQYKCNRECVYA